jgi:hypothetical protein
VFYEVRVQATVLGAVANYLVALTWVTIARVDQCLVNNASMELGLSSYIAYERAPQIDRGRPW